MGEGGGVQRHPLFCRLFQIHAVFHGKPNLHPELWSPNKDILKTCTPSAKYLKFETLFLKSAYGPV